MGQSASMLQDAAALALLCSEGESYVLVCFPTYQAEVARALKDEISEQARRATSLGIDVDPDSVTIEEIATVGPGYAGVRVGR